MGQTADELRGDIERTRDDLAETMEAIGDQISPKLQAQRQMDRLRQSGAEPQRLAMIGGAVLFVLLLIRRRRRRSGDNG